MKHLEIPASIDELNENRCFSIQKSGHGYKLFAQPSLVTKHLHKNLGWNLQNRRENKSSKQHNISSASDSAYFFLLLRYTIFPMVLLIRIARRQ